ncbi:hypothetical protein BGZ73_004561 [Actinomortierella ambigua]|nr:hypothetical protein BGZ73_004561 [Actinomortierella ambigua]
MGRTKSENSALQTRPDHSHPPPLFQEHSSPIVPRHGPTGSESPGSCTHQQRQDTSQSLETRDSLATSQLQTLPTDSPGLRVHSGTLTPKKQSSLSPKQIATISQFQSPRKYQQQPYQQPTKSSKKRGPLATIGTKKQTPIEKSLSGSTSNITSPMSPDQKGYLSSSSHQYVASPTPSKHNHNSLDAKVMSKEMAQPYGTLDVWQALYIQELLRNGMLTLNAKLSYVPDEKLVSRLVEVWSFFFGTVLPSTVQAGSNTLSAQIQPSGQLQGPQGSEGTLTRISGFSSSTLAVDAKQDDSEPEDVRIMALTSFRDLIIIPMVDRLKDVFTKLFVDIDASIPVTDTAARMLQMTSVLTSIQSGDRNQEQMEQVSNRLRTNWKQFTRRGHRGGFAGITMSTK